MVTFEALSLGNTDHINHLVRVKYVLYWYRLFKVVPCPVHLRSSQQNNEGTCQPTEQLPYLFSYCSTIDLDFHNVCLLLFQPCEGYLSVADCSDNFAVLLHSFQAFFNDLLAGIVLPLLSIPCEGLLLGNSPSVHRERKRQAETHQLSERSFSPCSTAPLLALNHHFLFKISVS